MGGIADSSAGWIALRPLWTLLFHCRLDVFSNLSLGFSGEGIVGSLSVLQHLLLPKAPWFSEFSILIATWCSFNCTTVKSCYFEAALLHSRFTFSVIGRLSLVLINTNPFFPTINGLLDSIIPMRICLMLSNMKLRMFSSINYPVLQHPLLKVLLEICNPKSPNLLQSDYEQERAWRAVSSVCTRAASGAVHPWGMDWCQQA